MKKLLIIEDDECLRDSVSEILSLSGYKVIATPEGKSGVEQALREKPDLILCDVTMPNLDGFGVLHILSRHPETAGIPFIFVTGRKELSDLRKGMGLGADDYLIKPFKESELLEAIEVRLKKANRIHNNSSELVNFFFRLKQYKSVEGIDGRWETNKYARKHAIYTATQTPKGVYFVARGKLKEFVINEDGKELILNIYSKGDFAGYKEVLNETKYTANLQVIEDSELIEIPKEDFNDLINSDEKIAREFISLLCRGVREQEERLVDLAYNSLRKKVANAIIKVVDKFKDSREGKPSIEISREDLSRIIGSAPESMIRTLREFKDEKLVEVSEGYIVVLNENKLRHLLY